MEHGCNETQIAGKHLHFNAGNTHRNGTSTVEEGGHKEERKLEESRPDLGGIDLDVDERPAHERSIWGSRLDFFLSCLGYSVGLGNIWRFPYICYRNGGGAFLLPYMLFLVVGGIPLVFLELSFGQFAGQGPVGVWRVAPLFKGVGIGMVVISAVVSIFYNVVIAWSLLYLFASMQTPLPWTTCGNDWNTPACCVDRVYLDSCALSAKENLSCPMWCRSRNGSLTGPDSIPSTDVPNITADSTIHTVQDSSGSNPLNSSISDTSMFTSPAAEYFEERVLAASASVTNLGFIWWPVALCLLAAWLLILVCLLKGIRSSGKVVYFTALFPYVMLLVLLVRTAMLEGAREGIIYYLQPKWDALANAQVWHDAATQVFFSLSACYGGLITLASYNRFDNNCYRTAIAVPILDTLSSMFAGAVVFATLGHLAWQMDTSVEGAVHSGPELVFIAYPEAIASMSTPQLWAFLFFLMLITVGLDSELVFVYTVTTALCDEFPRRLHKKRGLMLLLTCGTMFLLGLPLATQGGIHLFKLMDTYSTDWPIIIFSIVECLVLSWLYGIHKLQHDLWMMLGKRPGWWWQAAWRALTPAASLFVLAFSILEWNASPTRDDAADDADTELVAKVSQLLLTAMGLGPILLYAGYALISASGSLRQRLHTLLTPTPDWGPPWSHSDFKSNLLPDYMSSSNGETRLPNGAFGRRSSASTDDGTVSSVDGQYLPSPAGAQKGDDIDTGSIEWDCDENEGRGNWSGKYDFLISGLASCIGLGNIWRFPYLVYKNGGGAFFIPYLIMMILCGLPLLFLELAFSQFASTGPISIWRACPLFKGLGYSVVITTFLVSIYYSVLNSWSMYYLFASMTKTLPWVGCNNTWNTEGCLERSSFDNQCAHCSTDGANSTGSGFSLGLDVTTSSSAALESPAGSASNGSCNLQVHYMTPSEEYFFNQVLDVSQGIEELGVPRWHLTLCLLLCWTITFLALIRGVKSAGKVVYMTVSFPFVILLVLLIRYVTLDGHAHLDGIYYYINPDWSRLQHAEVWGDAASQLFFSLSLSHGTLMALSSYNRFHYNCYRDAYIICLADTVASAFAGFVVFAVIGVMAKQAGLDVECIVTSKFSLAYVTYPEAVSKLPCAPLWSVLFFLMLCAMGIDTQFIMVETVVIALMDEFPHCLGRRRLLLIAVGCVASFLLGLPMVSSGGMYIITLMDHYVAAWAPLISGILTCLAVAWLYKVKNLCSNIKGMLEQSIGVWYHMMWKFVTPAILVFVLVFSWVSHKPPEVAGHGYPAWALVFGWLISFLPVSLIPAYALSQLCFSKGSIREVLAEKVAPEIEWGPALLKHRRACVLPGVIVPMESLARTAHWVATGLSPQMFDTLPGQTNGIFHTISSLSASQPTPQTTTSSSEYTYSSGRELTRKRSSRTRLVTSAPIGHERRKRKQRVTFTVAGEEPPAQGMNDPMTVTDKSIQVDPAEIWRSLKLQPMSLKRLCLLKVRQYVDMDALRLERKRKLQVEARQRSSRSSHTPKSILKSLQSFGAQKFGRYRSSWGKQHSSYKTRSSQSMEVFTEQSLGEVAGSARKSVFYTVAQIEAPPMGMTLDRDISSEAYAEKHSQFAHAKADAQTTKESKDLRNHNAQSEGSLTIGGKSLEKVSARCEF